jgi:hypothetical protein
MAYIYLSVMPLAVYPLVVASMLNMLLDVFLFRTNCLCVFALNLLVFLLIGKTATDWPAGDGR